MPVFTRDRFTWLAYAMLGYYAFMQSSLGPLIPFLREEIGMNYTIAGAHLSAFALGMIGAGLTADRLARRWGRWRVFWGGGAGMALGGLLLMFGQSAPVTIATTLGMALIGSYLLVMIQATLADHHGAHRAFALTEANILASLAGTIAPLIVGFGQSSGIGWRVTLVVGVLAWVLMAVFNWRVPLPEAAVPARKSTEPEPAGRLPRAFWAYALVVFIGVSIEWCMIFWAADFMRKVVGFSPEAASSTVSLFFFATVIGRAAGSYFTRTIPTGRLLQIAAVIVLIGFPMFWLGRVPALNIIGLFVSGLGIANLFPLTLSAASSVGAANPNRASARISTAGGLAILITPQILGTAADQIGIQRAYGIVAPLGLAILLVTFYANRLTRKPV
jgi:predicted MFS family arabinose efflux permease